MANPTPAAIAAIQARVSDWSPTDAEIAAALNAATEINATPQELVPKALTVEALMGVLSPEAVAHFYQHPSWGLMRDDVRAQNRVGVATWTAAAFAAGRIAQADHDAVAAELAAQVDDPDWSAMVSWAVLALGRPVDARDVAAARPQEV